jgi:hypothetical protein
MCHICVILEIKFGNCLYESMSGPSITIVSDYRLDDRGSIPGRQRIFPLTSVSKPDLRSTQPSCTMGTGGPFLGLKHGRSVALTTHPEVTIQ